MMRIKILKFLVCMSKVFGIGKIVGQCESVKLIGFPTKKILNIRVKLIDRVSLKKIDKLFEEREIMFNLKIKLDVRRSKLVDMKSYRGLRYMSGLPVNGQRTQTNARTCKHRKIKKGINVGDDISNRRLNNWLKKKFLKKRYKYKKFFLKKKVKFRVGNKRNR